MNKWLWCLMVVLPVMAWSQVQEGAAPKPLGVSAGARRELTLDQLRERLAPTAQQLPLWNTYEIKVNAYTDVFYREKPVLASQEDTAPHQVARLVDNLQNRLAALEEVELAAKNLYATLSADQQKFANQWLLTTIPSFASVGPGDARRDDEGRRKSGKPEGGMRQHRGGGLGGGGMGGGGMGGMGGG